jgi:hypothetical protein
MSQPLHVVIIGAGEYATLYSSVRISSHEADKPILSGICGLLIAQGLEKVS